MYGMINFAKLSAQLNKRTIVNPTEIFMSLPSKDSKYSYLRNVQAEVLEQWYKRRDYNDNIIKMNTGSGKTTVALLILKSCLNECSGHAAYVVPDNYLVTQVIKEANALGIQVTDSEKDIDFIKGEAILVINIQKLFNGKSVFGMRNSQNISLDYILIDDVHACVDDVRSQFRIHISNRTDLANDILGLYKDDLRLQNEKKYLDICNGDPCSANIAVPFWRISETKSELLHILHKYKEYDEIKFNFPLIADMIPYCNCTVTYKEIEIEPYFVPVHKITSFCNAKRRVFMSATLCDDSQLVSTFDIKDISEIITPKQANDIGDRMILFPQAYSPLIKDDDIKDKILEYSQKYNVIVIVPSEYRAKYWKEVTNNIFNALNIKDGIDFIKSQANGLYVFVNKYDGIDLPDNACRIIVLDGLPDARSALEQINENYLQGTDNIIKNKIQKIEQGMGRGIRSNNDFCGVIIMGAQLVQILYSPKSSSFFSAATKKQFEVSSIMAKELKDKSIDEIFSVLDYCITQNSEWVGLSKSALSNLEYNKKLTVEPYYIKLREAFDLAVLRNQPENAKKIVCDLVNSTDDPILKGYFMLEEAKYCQQINPTDAQRILASAQNYNHHIIKPINGIKSVDYRKKVKPQARQILDDFRDLDVNNYIISINAAIDALIFAPTSYKKFEEAFANLGKLLGFEGMRITDGIGPDVLWYLGDLKYAVIECKNEAKNKLISKEYCGQLLSSENWFKKNFPNDCICIPVMIHPSNVFDKYASPSQEFKIINNEKLFLLKSKLKEFCKAIAVKDNFKNGRILTQILQNFSLTANDFFEVYATKYTQKNN